MSTNFAFTRPVNPPGATPKLTEEQLWKGLEKKARHPKDFIPFVTSSEVTKDSGDRVTRKVIFGDSEPIQEDIALYKATIAYFDSNQGHRITNVVSYDKDNELQLTFSFVGGIPGIPPQGASIAELNGRVGAGVDKTIAKIRQLVEEGSL